MANRPSTIALANHKRTETVAGGDGMPMALIVWNCELRGLTVRTCVKAEATLRFN